MSHCASHHAGRRLEFGTAASARMAALLLLVTMGLAGCVTREIKEDPWNAPRGSVNTRKYDTPTDVAKPQVLAPTGRSTRP